MTDETTVPGFLAWTEDDEFLVRAGIELLIALGVDEARARDLARLTELAERSEALDAEIAATRETTPDASWDPGEQAADSPDAAPHGTTVDDLTPEQRSQLDALVDEAARLALPLAHQTLDRAQERGVRPEIVGAGAPELRAMLADVQDLMDSGRWRGADGRTLEEYWTWIADRHDVRCPAHPPESSEIRAIVAVLRAMPKATLRRIAKSRNRLYLGMLVRFLLRTVRSDRASADLGTMEPAAP